MIYKVILAVVLLEAVSAMPSPDSPPRYAHPEEEYKEPPKPYQFTYAVQDDHLGANYGHQETSDGGAVQGSYQVALPDGRIQTVKYVADHINGYQAQVTYDREAVYPEDAAYGQSVEAPVYQPAPQQAPKQPVEYALEEQQNYVE